MEYSLVKVLLTVSPFPPSFNSNSVCIRAGSCYSLPTIDYPPSPVLGFHVLTNPSPRLIDLQVLYFHTLTNPFSRNPFPFSSIQNPPGVGGVRLHQLCVLCASALKNCLTPFLTYCCALLKSLYSLFQPRVLCFQSLADSFCKTPGGMGGRTRKTKLVWSKKVTSRSSAASATSALAPSRKGSID